VGHSGEKITCLESVILVERVYFERFGDDVYPGIADSNIVRLH